MQPSVAAQRPTLASDRRIMRRPRWTPDGKCTTKPQYSLATEARRARRRQNKPLFFVFLRVLQRAGPSRGRPQQNPGLTAAIPTAPSRRGMDAGTPPLFNGKGGRKKGARRRLFQSVRGQGGAVWRGCYLPALELLKDERMNREGTINHMATYFFESWATVSGLQLASSLASVT